jgi:hypothetical protein
VLIALTAWPDARAAYRVLPSGESAMPVTPSWPAMVVTSWPARFVTMISFRLLLP